MLVKHACGLECAMHDRATASGTRGLLIVDDEDDIRQTLGAYFDALGYAVETAAAAPEVLEKLRGGIQVVLADIRLPGMSGLEFLREARRLHPALTVLLMTGYPSVETIIDARQHQAAAYFRKPLNLVEVAARLRALCGGERTGEPGPSGEGGVSGWEDAAGRARWRMMEGDAGGGMPGRAGSRRWPRCR
jgi:DNA-binding response OmpR family regulator